MPKALTTAIAISACAASLPAQAMPDGRWLLHITPDGEFRAIDGRPANMEDTTATAWRMNAGIAAAVQRRFAERRNPAVIDYEHQTLNKEKNGQPAPAAGWIRELRYVPGQGLFAVSELTQRARELIAAGEYRFFSPVFEFDKSAGDVLDVLMGALTNHPGIDGMQPLSQAIAATAATHKEPSVNPLLKALLAALGLPETTTEDAATAALAALGPLKAHADRAQAALAALKLGKDATPEAITAACTSLQASAKADATPDPAKYVPVAVVDQIRGELATLTARQLQIDIDARIAPALADGRLLPAQETWARDLGKKDLAALDAYLKTAQPVAALTSTQTGGKAPAGAAGVAGAGAHGLSAEEIAVAAACGLTPEAYAKAKA